jgi:ribose transport system permease protein
VLSSILGIASIGQTLAIIVGGLDLSVASVIGLSSVMLAVLSAKGWPFALTAAAIFAVAVAVGALNGFLSHRLNAPALVVTLASGSILTGATMMLNRGSAGGTIPAWITESVSVNASTLGLPIPLVVVVWIVLTAVLVLLQRRSPSFRRIYASGMNPVAARLALVRLSVVWASAFAASAVAAAVAGLFLGGFSGGANIDVGQPYLFLTIAAVVVGGTSLLGGRGGLGRTMAGAFLISNLTLLLLGVGVGTNVQQMLLGALIVLLVFLYGREAHVRTRI